jgi:molybdopterin molybdotransferase
MERMRIRDANVSYITASLSGLVEIVKLGCVTNTSALSSVLASNTCDIAITINDSSYGSQEFLDSVIEKMGGLKLFRRVQMVPESSVLFASIPNHPHTGPRTDLSNITPPASPKSENQVTKPPGIVLFGLPEPPVALAACLRFIVIPYKRVLQSQQPLTAKYAAKLKCASDLLPNPMERKQIPKPPNLQIFWHSKLDRERMTVKISTEQDLSMIRPLLKANSWVSIPAGKSCVEDGDYVEVYDAIHLA